MLSVWHVPLSGGVILGEQTEESTICQWVPDAACSVGVEGCCIVWPRAAVRLSVRHVRSGPPAAPDRCESSVLSSVYCDCVVIVM